MRSRIPRRPDAPPRWVAQRAGSLCLPGTFGASLLLAALLSTGCPADDDDSASDDDTGDDDTGDDDTGDDDTGDDDTGDDDATGDDDTTSGDEALWGYLGQATVEAGVAYAGHEDLYFISHGGAGADLCRVRVTLTSDGLRDDCADCEWAFALTAADPEVVAESSVGCAGVGYDEAAIAGLTGTRGYGYAREYFGHTDVLMVEQGGIWTAVNFASWIEATGELTYDWEVGYLAY